MEIENEFDAIQLLIDDHKKIKGLFRQFEAVDQRAHVMKAGVCREIFMLLEIHTSIEESIFYPALKTSFQAETLKALVEQCQSDHEQLKMNLNELKNMDVYSVLFNERMNDLILETEQHISAEESELFTQARTFVPHTLSQIGPELAEEQARCLHLPQYRDAQPEKTQNPSGGEQKRTTSREAA